MYYSGYYTIDGTEICTYTISMIAYQHELKMSQYTVAVLLTYF